jgi:hypothetical protein
LRGNQRKWNQASLWQAHQILCRIARRWERAAGAVARGNFRKKAIRSKRDIRRSVAEKRRLLWRRKTSCAHDLQDGSNFSA